MRRIVLPAIALLIGAAPPPPAAVGVSVRAANGKPVPNAVVVIRLVGRETPAPKVGSGYAVKQQNIQFAPFVSVVPVMGDVAFPNLDTVRHQVYSFSSTKRFELKLYAREQNRTVRFDRPGPVPLGCNIHDQMSAFIYVTDSAFTGRTDANGNVSLAGVPAGAASITVWHPYLRAPGNQMVRPLSVGAATHEVFTVALRPPPAQGSSY